MVNIGLINPKSPDNVGSVLRASANYAVDRVFYTGKRYPRAIERKARTVDMSRKVSKGLGAEATACLIKAAGKMKIICVEFAENATDLPSFQHPEQAFYIFGPEDGSIEQAIIDQADDVVYIPTIGCMNLAATVNVLLYDRLAKSSQNRASNDLIRQSRDRNNRLKFTA